MASQATPMGIATAAIFGSLGLLWLYRRIRNKQRRQELRGKVVLITGASSGIGEACARAFYQAGCKVILCARRVSELERVQKELTAMKLPQGTPSHPPHILPMDLEKHDELPGKAREAEAIHGRVDVLVNNGGLSVRGSVVETTLAVHRKIMDVNYFGTLVLTKALLTDMIVRKSGHIVAISSIQGRIAIPYRSTYSASKHAVQAFFDSLRAEVVDHNVQVSVLSPSYIKTNLSLNALVGDGSPHAKMDSTIASGMTASYFAGRVVDAVVGQEKDVAVGPFHHRLAIYLRTLLPNLHFWVMAVRGRAGTKAED